MNLEEGILTRRSIRSYQKNNKLSKKDIDDILNMAMHAPSGNNTQPWEFVVVDSDSLFSKIMAIHPYCSFLKDAGAAIIVCGNLNEQLDEGYWIADCAAAMENLLLGAHAKGLGSCWCGIYPREERMEAFAKLLNLPDYVKPLGMAVIGYSDDEPKQPRVRFKPTKIHNNAW